MRRFLISFLLLVQFMAMSAQETVSTGGVIYKASVAGYCEVIGVEADCPKDLIILPEVDFDGTMLFVKRIASGALSGDIQSIEIKSHSTSRNFQIRQNAFAGCKNLETVIFPDDLFNFYSDIFIENTQLHTVVLDMVPPDRSDWVSPVLSLADTFEYLNHIRGVKLYVPDDAVEAYRNYNQGVSSGWPHSGFWSEFDIHPISELNDEPGPEPMLSGLRIPMPYGGAVVLLDAKPGHRVHIPSDPGCIFRSATFNGEDASSYIVGDVFTIPEYDGVADFVPVFEMSTSSAGDVISEDVNVRVYGNVVDVDINGESVPVEIYNSAGQCIYSGIGSGISLAEGVYILKVSKRTFKFAL